MNIGSKDLDALRETASKALIAPALAACSDRDGRRHGARRLADADPPHDSLCRGGDVVVARGGQRAFDQPRGRASR